MLLKKLSLSLSLLVSFNALSMEKQNDVKPSEEKTNQQTSSGKSLKVKSLKAFAAQAVLHNELGDQSLPDELKTYLKHFEKIEELKKHTLAPVFKKYLINCFDYLSLDMLKELLTIIEKSNEISVEKCMLVQKAIALTCKSPFCLSPLTSFIGSQALMFPHIFDATETTYKKIRTFYTDTPIDLENDELPYELRYVLALLDIAESPMLRLDSPCLKFLASSAAHGHAPSIYRLSVLKCVNLGPSCGLLSFKELMKHKALDDAAELVNLMLSINDGNIFSSIIEDLERQEFSNCLKSFIEMILEEDNYKSDYDLVLSLMYNYLHNKSLAKKYAKKFFQNNDGAFSPPHFNLLVTLYTEEKKLEKAAFYAKKLQEFEDLKNS